MRYEVEWHKTSEELPAPFADCYLAILDEPNDEELIVIFGLYDQRNNNFFNEVSGKVWTVDQVKYWTTQLIPWVDVLRENNEI